MKHPESILQQSCVKYLRFKFPALKNLFFAIPNGGIRSKIEAGIMQAEGVLPGVPDLFLAYPRPQKKLYGLFVEVKSSKGRVTPYQRYMHNVLETMGYKCVVIRNIDEFIKEVNDYIYGQTAIYY